MVSMAQSIGMLPSNVEERVNARLRVVAPMAPEVEDERLAGGARGEELVERRANVDGVRGVVFEKDHVVARDTAFFEEVDHGPIESIVHRER